MSGSFAMSRHSSLKQIVARSRDAPTAGSRSRDEAVDLRAIPPSSSAVVIAPAGLTETSKTRAARIDARAVISIVIITTLGRPNAPRGSPSTVIRSHRELQGEPSLVGSVSGQITRKGWA